MLVAPIIFLVAGRRASGRWASAHQALTAQGADLVLRWQPRWRADHQADGYQYHASRALRAVQRAGVRSPPTAAKSFFEQVVACTIFAALAKMPCCRIVLLPCDVRGVAVGGWRARLTGARLARRRRYDVEDDDYVAEMAPVGVAAAMAAAVR